jgi:hypothetical protein
VNPVERHLAVSGLNEIGEGLGLREGLSNSSGHKENDEDECLHVVSPKNIKGFAYKVADRPSWTGGVPEGRGGRPGNFHEQPPRLRDFGGLRGFS